MTQATPPVKDATVELNGFRMHYRDWGDPGAPPLLMVHGLTRECHAFDKLAQRLASRFRCIAIDVRGRGESEWTPPESYTQHQYVQDVVVLLEELGLKQVDYIGTSMGGLIGMQLAAQDASVFRRVVINDIGPDIPAEGSQGVRQHVTHISGGFGSFDELIDFEARRFPWLKHRPGKTVAHEYRYLVRHREDGRVYFHFDPNIVQGMATAPKDQARQAEQCWQGLKALDQAKVPVLLVRGAESNLLLPDTVARMRETVPGMDFVEVPGIGHAPTLSEPQATEALDRFLA